MRTAARLALAGMAGAAAFLLLSMIWYAAAGDGFWTPVNLVAHVIDRDVPMDGQPNAAAIAIGPAAATVVAIIALLPFLIAAFEERVHPALFVGAAAAYANVLWIVGHYLLWAAIDPASADRMDYSVAWVGHILAGLVASAVLAPVMQRAYGPLGGEASTTPQ